MQAAGLLPACVSPQPSCANGVKETELHCRSLPQVPLSDTS